MNVKMLETVQGVDISGVLLPEGKRVTVLEPGEEYQVADSLGAWLLEHRKAEAVTAVTAAPKIPHYGAQAEPALRHDDETYEQIKAKAEAPTEPPAEPLMNTKSQEAPKRARRAPK